MSDNLAYELWLPLASRVDENAEGLCDLTEDEQTLFLCYAFVCQFYNGGLSGYGYNKTAPIRKAVALALERLSAPQSANLIRRANKILDKKVPPEDAKTWDEFLAIADPDNQLDQIHSLLAEQIERENVGEAVDELAASMKSNAEE
ncbi:MAG: DUF4375 domain-containing protein [Planctomycetota bacterium]